MQQNKQKTVEVVAAAIIDERRVLTTQRGYGPWAGWWEFPGGKIEASESHQQALCRELHEELALDASVHELIATISYTYPDFHLVMHLYRCTPNSDITLLEHSSLRWLTASELETVRWLPADLQLIPRIAHLLTTVH